MTLGDAAEPRPEFSQSAAATLALKRQTTTLQRCAPTHVLGVSPTRVLHRAIVGLLAWKHG
eukprot:5022464-Lingulodinium_polyedra.AAC.1